MTAKAVGSEVHRSYDPWAADLDAVSWITHFHLDDADRALAAEQPSPASRLGLCVQLGTVRYLGRFLADPAGVPNAVVTNVAQQLGFSGATLAASYGRGGTAARHRARICAHDGYRTLSEPAVRLALVRWLVQRAWLTDERPEVLVELVVGRLRQGRVLLPGLSTLQRLVIRVQSRMEARLTRRLAAIPTAMERLQLEQLLVADEGGGMPLDRLRRGPVRISADGLVDAVDRLAVVQKLASASWDLGRVPTAKVTRLADEGFAGRAQALSRLRPERRAATLVAFAHTLRRTAQDDVVRLLDLYLRGLFGRVERKDGRERLQTLKRLDSAARDLAAACETLLDDGIANADVRAEALRRVPVDRLKAAVDTVAVLAGAGTASPLLRLAGRYPQLRRFLPGLLQHLDLAGHRSAQPVLDAWDFLRSVEGQRRPDLAVAPIAVVQGAWRAHVLRPHGTVDRAFYSWCVLDRLRDALRRRDVFVPGSIEWGDPNARLLQGQAWSAARPGTRRALDLPDSGSDAVEQLRAALDEAYRIAEAALTDHGTEPFTTRRGLDALAVAKLDRIPATESFIALRSTVATALPQVDLSEMLLEVDAWTGFAAAVAQARHGRPRIDGLVESVSAALLADACNIGHAAVSSASRRTLSPDCLDWVRQNYLRADAIAAANARLVDAQAALPLAREWGGGHVASADGLRFVVPVRSTGAAPNSRYFGTGRGVTYYNFVSDQHTGFHAVVVPGTLRDSLFVLDGLLEHRTRLEPEELMTDTAGYSDAVFGLFWLLGLQFSPRLRDVKDLRYWRLDRDADYGRLDGVARHQLRPERIERHWEDLLRIAGSLRAGMVRASDFMRTLQAGGRVTSLRQSVVELGRVIKTLYLLAYVSDAAYRRRILQQLNRGESRHAVARAVFFGRRGELRQPYRQGQEEQLGALGLVVNVIALWNTVYIGDILSALSAGGNPPSPADVRHLSPLQHAHVNLVGHYRFSLPERLAAGQRRPIVLPNCDSAAPDSQR